MHHPTGCRLQRHPVDKPCIARLQPTGPCISPAIRDRIQILAGRIGDPLSGRVDHGHAARPEGSRFNTTNINNHNPREQGPRRRDLTNPGAGVTCIRQVSTPRSALPSQAIVTTAALWDLSTGKVYPLPDTGTMVIGLDVHGSMALADSELGNNDCVIAVCDVTSKNGRHWISPRESMYCLMDEEDLTKETLLTHGCVLDVADLYIRYQLPRKPKAMSRSASLTIETTHKGNHGVANKKLTLSKSAGEEILDKLKSTEELSNLACSYISHEATVFTHLQLSSQELDCLYKAVLFHADGNEEDYTSFVRDYEKESKNSKRPRGALPGQIIYILGYFLKMAMDPLDHVALWLKLLAAFSGVRENLWYFFHHAVAPAILGAMSAFPGEVDVQVQGCLILTNLAAYPPEASGKPRLREGAIELVVLAMAHYRHQMELVRYGCQIIARVTQFLRTMLDQELHSSSAEEETVNAVARLLGYLDFNQQYGFPVTQQAAVDYPYDDIIQSEARRMRSLFPTASIPKCTAVGIKNDLPYDNTSNDIQLIPDPECNMEENDYQDIDIAVVPRELPVSEMPFQRSMSYQSPQHEVEGKAERDTYVDKDKPLTGHRADRNVYDVVNDPYAVVNKTYSKVNKPREWAGKTSSHSAGSYGDEAVSDMLGETVFVDNELYEGYNDVFSSSGSGGEGPPLPARPSGIFSSLYEDKDSARGADARSTSNSWSRSSVSDTLGLITLEEPDNKLYEDIAQTQVPSTRIYQDIQEIGCNKSCPDIYAEIGELLPSVKEERIYDDINILLDQAGGNNKDGEDSYKKDGHTRGYLRKGSLLSNHLLKTRKNNLKDVASQLIHKRKYKLNKVGHHKSSESISASCEDIASSVSKEPRTKQSNIKQLKSAATGFMKKMRKMSSTEDSGTEGSRKGSNDESGSNTVYTLSTDVLNAHSDMLGEMRLKASRSVDDLRAATPDSITNPPRRKASVNSSIHSADANVDEMDKKVKNNKTSKLKDLVRGKRLKMKKPEQL